MADQENKEQKKEKKPKPEGQAQQKGEGKGKGQRKPKGEQSAEAAADEAPARPAPPARMAIKYREQVVPALQQKFGCRNALAVPRLEKIVISMGLGKFVTAGDKAKMDTAEKELSQIAGQKPVRCKAKKAVSNFKVREGQETGLKVTLRGTRMYEFLDRLIALAIPRVKDFRGLPRNGFDGNGNYNFGFTEQTVFPEVDAAAVTFQQGMNITMVIGNAGSPDKGRALLQEFGFPFETPESKK
jgi:large subunit ribosomal protein L5